MAQISLPLLVIREIVRQMRTRVGMDIAIDHVQKPIHIGVGIPGRSMGEGSSHSLGSGRDRGGRIDRGQGKGCYCQAFQQRIQGTEGNCCLRSQLVSWTNREGGICSSGVITAVVPA